MHYLPPVQNATLQPSWPSDIGAVQTWFSITRINHSVDPKFRVTDFLGISNTEKLTKPRDNSFWNLQSHKLRSNQKKIPVNEQRRFSWPAPCPGIKAQKKVDICSDSRSESRLDGCKRRHVASNKWLPNEFTQLQVGHGPTCCMSHVHPCPEKRRTCHLFNVIFWPWRQKIKDG